MPDKVPSPLPPQCALDRGSIERIDTNLLSLTKKFDEFISFEGPFVEVKERLTVVENKTDGLVARTTGIVISILGIAWFVITKFLTGGGNG